MSPTTKNKPLKEEKIKWKSDIPLTGKQTGQDRTGQDRDKNRTGSGTEQDMVRNRTGSGTEQDRVRNRTGKEEEKDRSRNGTGQGLRCDRIRPELNQDLEDHDFTNILYLEFQLTRKRNEFWDTAPAFEGKSEVWAALKE